ncbi:MAG: TonB-dependent receptor [Oleiphilaceae bacterium]|nr:TonB-dependent receptor [Oleiphilaceae bacterium]
MFRTPRYFPLTVSLGVIALIAATPLQAQESGQDDTGQGSEGTSGETLFRLNTVHVLGQTETDYATATGAAHRVDEGTLERDEHDNIHRILQDVPGVYVRGEDGFGNRPNIGLRGTTTERSQKITLMVDGVLAAPAAYSAPAAYYFPQVSRMTGVEVVKGPAAIRYGPATVGGALNLVTRPVPSRRSAGLDLAVGEDGYRKAHGYAGDAFARGGVLVEGIQTRSDGFKNLDNGADTGFEKNDLMVKGRLFSDPSRALYQQLDLSLEYADETSDETYLGLTDGDFRDTPYRRYAASQNALFEWTYRKAQLSHLVEFSDRLSLTTTGYYQTFERDWNKLNGFNSDRSLNEILANPDAGLNQEFMAVLRGEKDSDTNEETLIVGSNDREFFSRGIQSMLSWSLDAGPWQHNLSFGARFHQDQIERNHTEQGFLMRSGRLEADGEPVAQTLLQRENADAIALFVQDDIRMGRWRITPGVRLESVDYESVNQQTGRKLRNDNREILPAIGAFYQWRPSLGFLAGVHRGFVPSGPGVGQGIEPEKSISYEAGMRYNRGVTRAELIGFFNDYSNLKGVCTFSSGCTEANGEAFNGGAVEVYGLEAQAGHEWRLNNGWAVPGLMTYTFTETEFQTTFDSDFALWGERVRKGDPLPYMPRHQLAASLGLEGAVWGVNLKASYFSEQDEQSGEGGPLEDSTVPSYTVLDATAHYRFTPGQEVYLKANNLLDEEYLISRRPFGARPGQPRTLIAGYKIRF